MKRESVEATKYRAQKLVKSLRAAGRDAWIVRTPGGFAVYSNRAAKAIGL